jgi:hypothetical protein
MRRSKMKYQKERNENIPCGNDKCQFFKQNNEIQNCDAEAGGEPAVASCKVYVPQIDPPKCLICNKKLESDKTFGSVGGIVDNISAGFSSIHDGKIFCITMCDACISILEKEQRIKFIGNYVTGEEI